MADTNHKYVSEDGLTTLISLTKAEIAKKADDSAVVKTVNGKSPTSGEITVKGSDILVDSESLGSDYTVTETLENISPLIIKTQLAVFDKDDAVNFYTKSETDTKLATKADNSVTYTRTYGSSTEEITKTITKAIQEINDESTQARWNNPNVVVGYPSSYGTSTTGNGIEDTDHNNLDVRGIGNKHLYNKDGVIANALYPDTTSHLASTDRSGYSCNPLYFTALKGNTGLSTITGLDALDDFNIPTIYKNIADGNKSRYVPAYVGLTDGQTITNDNGTNVVKGTHVVIPVGVTTINGENPDDYGNINIAAGLSAPELTRDTYSIPDYVSRLAIPFSKSTMEGIINRIVDSPVFYSEDGYDLGIANIALMADITRMSIDAFIYGADDEIRAMRPVDENGVTISTINGLEPLYSDLESDGKGTITYVRNFVTKSELSDAISALTAVKFSVVDALPTTGEDGVIYLVAHSHTDDDDTYDEYIWLSSTSKFEKIGNTDIDLSGYLKATDVTTIDSTAVTTLWNSIAI